MSTLESIFGPHTKLRSFALVFAAAAAIYNFPALVSWLPQDTQDALMLAADTILKNGVLAALLFAKQSNVSGNGTLDLPAVKPDGTGGTRTLLMLLVLASLGIAGCTASVEWQTPKGAIAVSYRSPEGFVK